MKGVFFMRKMFLIAAVCGLLQISCVTEILPLEPSEEWICKRGEDLNGDGVIDFEDWLIAISGKDGKDLYALWVEDVVNGLLDWPVDEISKTDFYRYFKGEKGDDGLSAYELWVIDVMTGIANPHGDGMWPKGEISMRDFYAFLTGPQGVQGIQGERGEQGPQGLTGSMGERGEAGQSALELWLSLLGIPGAIDYVWDENLSNEQNFFEFLKGEDGPRGEPGQNGINGLPGMDGNPGKNGASAYELWLCDVNSGVIVWDGGTTYEDFWVFLKGEPGEKGDTGERGADGKQGISAYDMWVAMVISGLDNPHNPGNDWPVDQIGVLHFYQYLRGNQGMQGIQGVSGAPGAQGIAGIAGENGQSAYEIWKVLLESEIISWDEWDGNSELTQVDFFTYLKGKDGKDGENGLDGLDGKDGQNGAAGLSAYELWLLNLPLGYDGGIDLDDFFAYLKGEDGRDGENGTNGLSAYDVWVQDVKDGLIIDQEGKVGYPGFPWPVQYITRTDYYNYLIGADGNDGRDGEDGRNGFDGVNGENGRDGVNGHDGQNAYELWVGMVTQNEIKDRDGNPWNPVYTSIMDFYQWLSGEQGPKGDTGEQGEQGDEGEPGEMGPAGLSAYELWVREVQMGAIFKDGKQWDSDMTSTNDFWNYLSGEKGEDGKNADFLLRFANLMEAYVDWRIINGGGEAHNNFGDFVIYLQSHPDFNWEQYF